MSAMAVVKKRVSVEEAIAAYLERLRSLRYSHHSIARKRGYCKALRAFAQDRKAMWLTTDLICAFFANEDVDEEANGETMTVRQRDLRCTMWALRDFTLHGHFHKQKCERRIPPGWQAAVDGYMRFCAEYRGLAKSTLRDRESYVAHFCQFLDGRGAATPQALTSALISEFLLSVSHLHSITLSSVVGILRSFFEYLFMSGLVTDRWGDQLSEIRCAQPDRLPAIWRPEEVEALLRAVDRSSPVGKRDFAILLLAARMGMRVGEIRKLRLDHLRWEDASVSFVQSKTGVAQVLPLTEEVGAALIDYLRDGRPKSEHREVFLRCRAPFEPFSDYTNLARIVTKHRLRAGIRFAPDRKQGMHSLRHTVASRLLEIGVGFETISGLLGHRSLETTRQYTRIDVDKLRTVALAPEDTDHD